MCDRVREQEYNQYNLQLHNQEIATEVDSWGSIFQSESRFCHFLILKARQF